MNRKYRQSDQQLLQANIRRDSLFNFIKVVIFSVRTKPDTAHAIEYLQ